MSNIYFVAGMEALLKEALSTKTLRPTCQSAGGGCISNGEAYFTDDGTVFVKSNNKPKVSEVSYRRCMRVVH